MTGINFQVGEQMTSRLEQAFAAASKLPPTDQDALAEWLIQELESERSWDRQFEKSQDALARLAEEALKEDEAGETEPLYPDRP